MHIRIKPRCMYIENFFQCVGGRFTEGFICRFCFAFNHAITCNKYVYITLLWRRCKGSSFSFVMEGVPRILDIAFLSENPIVPFTVFLWEDPRVPSIALL